jgi:sulfonate transport system substrate-binding protein
MEASPAALRVGYFPNLAHAPAILGIEKGFIARHLGRNVSLKTMTFNAGPEAVTALFSDAVDIAYIGPNPTLNAFRQSHGRGIRVIAGCTSGGAALVVKPDIRSAADLRGKKIAAPQLGNTQDVALRSWLAKHGFQVTQEGGDVRIVDQANAQTLATFQSGAIQGAWVPEPWATRLLVEGGGKILVDEATLWPGGKFVTTQVIARTEFLRVHPDVVARFLRGHVEAIDFANSDPDEARAAVGSGLEKLTGRKLPADVITPAWKSLVFTVDPLASTLRGSAEDARRIGLFDSTDLQGLYALDSLNEVLRSLGRSPVAP